MSTPDAPCRSRSCAAIVAREASNRVILKTEGDRLIVTAESGGVGKAREDVEALFELTGSLSPGPICSVSGSDYLYVIMPMQIV